MAKQVGPIKFRGALDDVCGRLTEDGAILQGKTGPTRQQVLKHKSFINTRRNAAEFGGAVSASTLLRRVLGYTVKAVKHAKLVSYMNKQLHEVMRSDTQSGWGERSVNKGNLQMLEGFDYNQQLGLDVALPVALSHKVDTVTGQVQLSVPGCLVRHKRVFPREATHFRIVSCAGAVNFIKKRCSFHIVESELLPLGKQMAALHLEHQLAGKPGEVMLHTVGMVFYEVVDGKERMLRGGVLRVVEVTRVVAGLRVVERKDTSVIDKNNPRRYVPMVERQACTNVCVEDDAPIVQLVVAKKKTCDSCVLPELLAETVRGITLAVVEENVVYEAVMYDLAGVVEEGMVDVSAEADDFTVGITDAKGTPLQGAVAASDGVTGKASFGKKSRLRRYCKGVKGY
jgi:hypothetical protein